VSFILSASSLVPPTSITAFPSREKTLETTWDCVFLSAEYFKNVSKEESDFVFKRL
jgi:hypothetical protein